jgi:tRNA-specific 2-thiouridylase
MTSKSKSKVLVAMSGGVDSSVAAALLKEQGYDVVGVTMQIWDKGKGMRDEEEGSRSCCSVSAVDDAKRVAGILGIPHYVLNYRKMFEEKVIKDFIREYAAGRTPNPCIRCNEFLKFDALIKKADELGADYVATGHYARVNSKFKIKNSKVRYELLKGKDKTKDQSYVLYTLNQKNLARILFPLGGLTKNEVRKIARSHKLPVADKKESQEICFVPDDDYGKFLKKSMGDKIRSGPIINTEGKVIGKHNGIVFYTVGQRRGLGIAAGHPLYVVKIDKKKNAIVVGNKEEALGRELVADRVNYILGEAPKSKLGVKAKIRYNTNEADVKVIPIGKNKVRVKFKKPQHAITPGQSVVFYKGDSVLGGGIISKRTG